MDQSKLSTGSQFSQPIRQIISLLIVSGLSGLGVIIAAPSVWPIFSTNIYLNGAILFVFAIGVISCFAQVVQLIFSVRWLESFAGEKENKKEKAPRLLAPLATLLGSRSAKTQIAASSTRSILDSVATRIEEAREFTRYIVNVLIYLGLLGTFYGLATTVPALVETIRSLVQQDGETGVEVFNRLMNGLEGQLNGMGVAFASSLLGLAGSLVVGLLELFASHGQNRFYRELEEWLSSITRLGFSSTDTDGNSDQVVINSVLDQMSEQMEVMQLLFSQSENSRTLVDEKLSALAENLGRLTDQLGQSAPSNSTLERVATGQEKLFEVLANIEKNYAVDAESRMRLRSIDVHMLQLMEDLVSGRQEITSAIRTELSSLSGIISEANTKAKGKK